MHSVQEYAYVVIGENQVFQGCGLFHDIAKAQHLV